MEGNRGRYHNQCGEHSFSLTWERGVIAGVGIARRGFYVDVRLGMTYVPERHTFKELLGAMMLP
jgi:hypothetical protein